VNDPDVVFLDEPTTGLDPQARRRFWELIRSVNQEGGKTIILTTHYLEEAELLSDRVAIIDHGRIQALDTPTRLIRVKGALIGFLPITKVLRKLLPVGWRRLNWLKLGATGVARFLRARAEAYFLPQNQLGFTG
jgi:energy-coupling factor transporter ATP-binding protein EcfA2